MVYDDAMQVVWDETNVIISTVNDMLSAKKEIAQSQVDTLIPLLVVRLGSVQAAVDYATDTVRSSIQRLEAAEKDMLSRYEADPKVQDIQRYIDGCKVACTANLKWSLTSGRYGISRESMAGGISITL
ncbi:isoprenoid synthase domain-containing protein [Hypoxylon sp. FL1284]|nr:isoprenoid synthase domain-containing protein [Hypoxylon sp. FL1284]